MSDQSIDSPRRRQVLAGVGAGLVAYSTGVGTTAADNHESVRVVLDNVGASAWELVESDQDVGEEGNENPSLTLQEGTRYTFENRGGSSHPLAFRDEDGNDLLSQSSTGSYEDQDDVDYVEDGDEMTFTLTQQFAEDVESYICTFHASMEGQVETVDSDELAAAVEMSDQETDGTSVTVDYTRVDDGGFMTIHDSSLLDGEVIPSVRGVSEYLEPGEYDDLEVELDDPLTGDDTLIAMPHRDTNDNEEYDFVDTEGGEDGPYADGDGDAIVDDADVTVTDDTVVVSLDNVGASAWEVTGVTGGAVAPVGPENPTLTLREGVRYRFENGGWDSHPLAIRAADSEELLTQDGEGSFEGDSETDWVDEGDAIAFTVTGELADELDNYICTVHGSMEGDIEVLGADAPAAETEIADQETDGTSVTVDYTRIDDGGFITIHDSSLLDGEVIPSVRGVSEYLDPGVYDDLEVELDDPLTEDDTLIAMPHRDTNDNEEYDFVDTEGAEDGPYADEDGEAVVDDAAVTVVDDPAALTFGDQATASSTFTQGEPTMPGVAVEDVTAPSDSAVVITYEEGGDLVIAGLDTFDAGELDGTDVVVPVEDDGGFPGEHVAHIIPLSELSGEYAAGNTVSSDTAAAVTTNDAATVLQADLSFEDQAADEAVAEGDVMATVDVSVSDGSADDDGDSATQYSTADEHDEEIRYVVDVHPTDDDGELVAPEYVGSTDVLAGDNPGAEIVAQRVPDDGDFNELPFEGTDTFVAMIHVVDDGSAVGDDSSPGSFPFLPNVDADDGPVPGGVTDTAEVTAEPDGDGDDDPGADDDPGEDNDPSETDDTDDTDDADDDGAGFGPVAGAAGLGGLAAYAYKKLKIETAPPTPEDDGLDEQEE